MIITTEVHLLAVTFLLCIRDTNCAILLLLWAPTKFTEKPDNPSLRKFYYLHNHFFPCGDASMSYAGILHNNMEARGSYTHKKNKIIINQRPEKCFERDRNLSVTAD